MKSLYYSAEDKTNQKYTTSMVEESDEEFVDGPISESLTFYDSLFSPSQSNQRGKEGGHHQHYSQHMDKSAVSQRYSL